MQSLSLLLTVVAKCNERTWHMPCFKCFLTFAPASPVGQSQRDCREMDVSLGVSGVSPSKNLPALKTLQSLLIQLFPRLEQCFPNLAEKP